MIELKTPGEIALMRRAGAAVAALLDSLVQMIRPGVKTKALDERARAFLHEQGMAPAFLGYRGYPASICVSINEEVVHGIPGDERDDALGAT